VYESRASRSGQGEILRQGFARLGEIYGIKIGSPTVFPVNSVKAMRGAFVADEHRVISRYSRRMFESYWTDDKDISQDDVLREIVNESASTKKNSSPRSGPTIQSEAARQRRGTDRARRFGSPTIFVEGSIFFGNDRLRWSNTNWRSESAGPWTGIGRLNLI